MKVLHYSLGIPPFRTGGLVKYCMDLIDAQSMVGDEVSILYPGRMLASNKLQIKERKTKKLYGNSFLGVYELINPMPISLIDGIKEIDKFICDRNIENIKIFFEKNDFDIFHVHTLMGLPQEVLQLAKKNNVKIIFTTHDYFGLCPKLSFVYGNTICPEMDSCKLCGHCNKNALSINKIKLLQSNIYKVIKQTSIIKRLRKKHIKSINEMYKSFEINDVYKNEVVGYNYQKLRQYYLDMISVMDIVHYNSTYTKSIFNRFICAQRETVISISNKSIEDNRKVRKKQDNIIKIGYLGPQSARKGFFILLACMDRLYITNKNVKLIVYNGYNGKEYVDCNYPYSHSELASVMESFDILIVPSLVDSFGFTVLEALSYGVPVITSNTVGAKDLIKQGINGYVFSDEEELYKIIENVVCNPMLLELLNENICLMEKVKTMDMHEKEIKNLYMGIVQ